MKTSLLLRQIALLIALCISGYALAFPPDLSKYKQRVEQNATYGLDEKIVITYALEYPDTASLSDITVSLPGIDKIEGLKLLYGPAVISSLNYTSTNNVIKKTSKASFQFILKATEPGHYDLPDFVVTDKTTGKAIDFPPAHASFTVSNDEFSTLEEKDEDTISKMDEPKTFLHAIISHDNIKVGESTTLTLKLLSNEDLRALEYCSRVEAEDCFISSSTLNDLTHEVVEYEGKKYREYLIGEYNITPLKSGEFTLKPITVKCTIGPSFMDIFYPQKNAEDKTVTITSNPITLKAEK